MPITLIDNNNNKQERYSGIFTLNANKWFLPTGISSSDVIAAYRFKGVASETAAILNENNNGLYPLTKIGSPVWASTGALIPASYRVGYNNASITSFQSVAVRYSDAQEGNVDVTLVSPVEAYCLAAKLAHSQGDYQTYRLTPGVKKTNKVSYWSSTEYSYGVLVWNYVANQLFHNGVNLSLSSFDATSWPTTHNQYILIGNDKRYRMAETNKGSVRIQAVAFYNAALTPAQVAELTNSMNAL